MSGFTGGTGTNPQLMQLMQLLQAYIQPQTQQPQPQQQRFFAPAQQDNTPFLTPGLASYIPGLGSAAPWLGGQAPQVSLGSLQPWGTSGALAMPGIESSFLNADTLLQYANAGHPVALAQLNELRGMFPGLTDFGAQHAVQGALNYGVNPNDLGRLLSFQSTAGLFDPPKTKLPGVVEPSLFEPVVPKPPSIKPNLLQAPATQTGQPNPMDRVLGGTAGMNPFQRRIKPYGGLL